MIFFQELFGFFLISTIISALIIMLGQPQLQLSDTDYIDAMFEVIEKTQVHELQGNEIHLLLSLPQTADKIVEKESQSQEDLSYLILIPQVEIVEKEIKDMTVKELKAIAKAKGLSGYSKLRRNELLALLS